jgi:hypothetical protein
MINRFSCNTLYRKVQKRTNHKTVANNPMAIPRIKPQKTILLT